MARGLTREERQARKIVRRRVIELLQLGWGVQEVADAVGVHRSSVCRWERAYNAGGLVALEGTRAPGATPKLTVTQAARLRALIVGADPRQLRFPFALWTREMVRELIQRRFAVEMSVSAVGRLLRGLGLSTQRPLWRAYQADPDAVEAWKRDEFPRIRAQAKAEGALIFFGDEAGVRSDYHAGTTWGEAGSTPVLHTTGARHRVNMISAVSPKGKLHFRLLEGSVNAAAFVEYCRDLASDYRGRIIYLIVDGHPSHKATMTKEWVRAQNGRFQLFYLPGYSPQLNPDEWVWKNVKHDRIGRAGITTLADLRAKAFTALQRIAHTPAIIRSFFYDPNLRYIIV